MRRQKLVALGEPANARTGAEAALLAPLGGGRLLPSVSYRRAGFQHASAAGYFAPQRAETVEGGLYLEGSEDGPWSLAADLGGGMQRVTEHGVSHSPHECRQQYKPQQRAPDVGWPPPQAHRVRLWMLDHVAHNARSRAVLRPEPGRVFLAGGASEEGGDDVGRVALERHSSSVVPHGGARIRVTRGLLHVTQRHTGIEWTCPEIPHAPVG